MIELSKPVLTFLSNLAKERAAFENADSTDQTLHQGIQNAEAKRTDALPVSLTFTAPQLTALPPGPRMQKIQYSKPASEVEKAMKLLKVRTFTAVGEKTFEYFMEYEGEE
jgi:hypothetical protein